VAAAQWFQLGCFCWCSLFSNDNDEQEGLLTSIIVNGLLCIRDIHRAQRGHERLALSQRRVSLGDCYCERRLKGHRKREREKFQPRASLFTILFGSSPATRDVTLWPLRNLIQLHAVGGKPKSITLLYMTLITNASKKAEKLSGVNFRSFAVSKTYFFLYFHATSSHPLKSNEKEQFTTVNQTARIFFQTLDILS
jgi:hypothetical protein